MLDVFDVAGMLGLSRKRRLHADRITSARKRALESLAADVGMSAPQFIEALLAVLLADGASTESAGYKMMKRFAIVIGLMLTLSPISVAGL